VTAGGPGSVGSGVSMTALASTEVAFDLQRRHRALGVAAVLGATLFWSCGGSLGKATGVNGVVLGFWRMWIAAVVISAVAFGTGRRPTRADLRFAPMGVLFGLNICAFFISIQYLSISITLIIGALTPVVALPVAVLAMGERLTALKAVCALAAVAGVVSAVLTAPSGAGTSNRTIGYVYSVASMLIWVGYLLVSKRARREVETVRLMWVVTITGALTLSVLAIATRAPLGSMHGTGWLWVTLLSVGPGLAGHGLFAWAQPRVDSSVSTVLIQGEPVGASIIAWIFLGQSMTLGQSLSMAVVLAALCVLVYHEAREGRARGAAPRGAVATPR
jgi:drug/metabolite transporter (DMT)-like permease